MFLASSVFVFPAYHHSDFSLESLPSNNVIKVFQGDYEQIINHSVTILQGWRTILQFV